MITTLSQFLARLTSIWFWAEVLLQGIVTASLVALIVWFYTTIRDSRYRNWMVRIKINNGNYVQHRLSTPEAKQIFNTPTAARQFVQSCVSSLGRASIERTYGYILKGDAVWVTVHQRKRTMVTGERIRLIIIHIAKGIEIGDLKPNKKIAH